MECGKLLVRAGTGGTWDQRVDSGAMALTWHSRQETERWGEGGPREVTVRTAGKAPGFGDQAGVVKTAKVSLIPDSDAEDFCVGNAGVDWGYKALKRPSHGVPLI